MNNIYMNKFLQLLKKTYQMGIYNINSNYSEIKKKLLNNLEKEVL